MRLSLVLCAKFVGNYSFFFLRVGAPMVLKVELKESSFIQVSDGWRVLRGNWNRAIVLNLNTFRIN